MTEGELNGGDDNITVINDGNCTEPNLPTFDALYKAFFFVALAVGIPGNILSAIVWLRQGITMQSSSAVYLAALAINDLTYLLSTFLYISVISNSTQPAWLYDVVRYLAVSAATLEPLLVLGFSVERLIAILRPMKVRCLCVSSQHMHTHPCQHLTRVSNLIRLYSVLIRSKGYNMPEKN